MGLLQKKIFLSGAISGHEKEAADYFARAEKIVLERFPLAQVFNPANLPANPPESPAWRRMMTICAARIMGWATDIVYIRNEYYEGSKGARIERALAQERGLGEYVLRGELLSELPKEEA